MKKINKLLFAVPFALLIVGCNKANSEVTKSKTTEKKTTLKETTKKSTTNKTIRTTTVATTTEEDVFDVLVVKNFEDAATIKGEGIFNLNSSTTISITLNYGYEYIGLFNGEKMLTDELTYEVKDINESINLYAMFKPIDYMVSINKNIEDVATISGDGYIPYKNSTIINATLDPEYLFVGLYDGEELLSDVLPYEIKSVTKDLNLNMVLKQKTYDVVVNQSLEDAAKISGVGSFVKGSNTTLTIETFDGYNYLGLYDSNDNLLTTEPTYEVNDITDNITFMASFSANSYKVTTSSFDEDLGTVTLIDGIYDCGSIIELTATPIEGYEVEGWYVNGTLYENYGKENTINFKTLAFDSEVVVKFTIKTFSITITDNIDGLGRFYVDGNLYDSTNIESFDWDSYISCYFDNVLGYNYSYALINGEECNYVYQDLYMDNDYTIEVFYELADMEFYMVYDREKLSVNNGILIDLLPDNFETGVIDNEYSQYDKYSYIYGTYKYKTIINITLNVKTNYYLEGLFDTYENESLGTINNNVITLSIDNNYSELCISLLGKICHIDVYVQDEITGSATGTGDYHYGDKATIKATPNKGYKLLKWVDEEGVEYGVIYGIEHDHVPSEVDVPLYGDATYIAVFIPDDFDCDVKLVAYNKNIVIETRVLTYLTEYKIEAPIYSGYTFAGWLENEDISSLFSSENVLNYTMINEKATIYAYYTPNTYTVTFDFDGGVGLTTTKELVFGDEFSIDVPTKDNYTFMEYDYYHEEETHYYDNDSTQLVYFIARIFNTTPANAEGVIEKGVVLVNDVKETNSSAMIYRNDKVTIISYNTGVKVVKANGSSNGGYAYPFNAKFIAIWGAQVTKRLNNDEDDLVKKYYIGEKVSRYETPENTGFNFLGWYVGDELYDFSTPLEHNIVIEAKWEAIDYNVTLSVNNTKYGKITTPVTSAKYGEKVTLSYSLYDNYTFEYWYNTKTKEIINYLTFTFIMPAEDVYYTACATALVMMVKVNDSVMGSVENNYIVARVGQLVYVKAIPNDGYGFDHWELEGETVSTNLETTVTMPNLGIATLTAIFGKEITDKYERLGNKVWFGYYPQTCLNPNLQSGNNADLINELKELAGTLPTLDTPENYEATKDSTQWINYDYYIYPGGVWNKSVYNTTTYKYDVTYLKAPHMWYIDIDYDEDGRYDYRGVLIYSYRPDEVKENTPSAGTNYTHQDDNFYGSSSVYSTYWFKYELIEWDILENNAGTVKMIANLAIDSQNFSLSSNDYDSSYIRNFLNDDFYNTAFSSLEKSIMSTMSINSNNDYVTLLTNEEVESYYPEASNKFLKTTEYAQSQNCYVNTSAYSSTTLYNCNWLTRSAYTESGKVYIVNTSGSITNGKTNMTYYGIRPVITITLKKINA